MINSRASHWLPRCRDDKSWALLQAAVPVLGLSRRTPHNLEPGHFLSFSIYLITTIWCKQEFYSCNLSFLLQQYVKWLQGRKKKSPLLPQESISVFAGLKKETFCLYSEAMISFVPCIWMLALYLMCLLVFSWKTSIKILTHTHTVFTLLPYYSQREINDICEETDLISKVHLLLYLWHQCTAHGSDKFIDFPLMRSYRMEVRCRLTACWRMPFTQVRSVERKRVWGVLLEVLGCYVSYFSVTL